MQNTLIIGPVSSLFDYLTFFTMLFVFNCWTPDKAGLFQTGWFIESLCSQTLVVLIIRTRMVPFYKSKPSKYLIVMLLTVISFAIIIPFTPVGAFFGFVPPPPLYYLILAGILGAYAVLAETVKRWFYKRYGQRVEQTMVPNRKTIFSLSRTTKIVQDMVAVISLRFEDEFSIDSLTDDLKSAFTIPLNSDQLVQNLEHLKRSDLISVDWQKRMIKRKQKLKEYVKKNLTSNEMWPTIAEDWRRINTMLQNKYNNVNAEYQELLFPKQ
jgi:hypothetical protein